MNQENVASRSFLQQANDIRCRAWYHRLGRLLRGRLRLCCAQGMLLADDPRVVTAWRQGWDAEHYVRLCRWRDTGFSPRAVYDIGAHGGAWSEMCQRLFAPDYLILFEPQSACRERALKRQPHGANWQILPVALGERDEPGSLFVTQNRTASSLLPPSDSNDAERWETNVVQREPVQIVALDSLAGRENLPEPDLIKIDVQGYEGRVLAGGKQTVAQARRVIVEVAMHATYEEQPLMPEVLSTLTELGFVLEDVSEAYREWPGPMLYADLWLKKDT